MATNGVMKRTRSRPIAPFQINRFALWMAMAVHFEICRAPPPFAICLVSACLRVKDGGNVKQETCHENLLGYQPL